MLGTEAGMGLGAGRGQTGLEAKISSGKAWGWSRDGVEGRGGVTLQWLKPGLSLPRKETWRFV